MSFSHCGKFEGISLFLCKCLGHIMLQPIPLPADCGVLQLGFFDLAKLVYQCDGLRLWSPFFKVSLKLNGQNLKHLQSAHMVL